MGKRVQRTIYGKWVTPETGEVLNVARRQTASTYIGCRKGGVAHWVSLKTIFEICALNQGFEGGGRRGKLLWQKNVLE